MEELQACSQMGKTVVRLISGVWFCLRTLSFYFKKKIYLLINVPVQVSVKRFRSATLMKFPVLGVC